MAITKKNSGRLPKREAAIHAEAMILEHCRLMIDQEILRAKEKKHRARLRRKNKEKEMSLKHRSS